MAAGPATVETLVSDDNGAEPWERRPDERSDQHAAFRFYRDMAPAQRNMDAVAEHAGVTASTIRRWRDTWDWRDRAVAWDDARYRLEDQERLEAIRSMHRTHRQAGRAATVIAMQALALLKPQELNATQVARLLALGAKLERDTLVVSVEELQGVEELDEVDDPWERIAAELDPDYDRDADLTLE